MTLERRRGWPGKKSHERDGSEVLIIVKFIYGVDTLAMENNKLVRV